MSDMGFYVPRSPEHRSNGGTGVTNFTEDRRAAYVEAVKRHGDADLWVAEKSFGEGNEDYGGSMHCKGVKDLSGFWEIYYKVKAEMGIK